MPLLSHLLSPADAESPDSDAYGIFAMYPLDQLRPVRSVSIDRGAESVSCPEENGSMATPEGQLSLSVTEFQMQQGIWVVWKSYVFSVLLSIPNRYHDDPVPRNIMDFMTEVVA